MKNIYNIFFVIAFNFLLIFIFLYLNAYSYPTGISGKTKKTTTSGCGNCHNFGTYITAVINGPDTINKGESAQFSITITKTNNGKGGLDIAALKGVLNITGGENYIKLLNGELVHQNGIVFTNSITVNFGYTAPNIVTTDTIFATVNAGYQGRWNFVPEKIITVKSSIGIVNSGTTPFYNELKQNYPNPFNPVTTIKFHINHRTYTSLSVFDILGKKISELVDGILTEGSYEIVFDGSKYPSGIYFYRLSTENFVVQKKMVLAK